MVKTAKNMKNAFVCALLVCVAFLSSCGNDSTDQNSKPDVALKFSLSTEAPSRVTFTDGLYAWEGNEMLGLFIASATPTLNAPSAVEVVDGRGYCNASVYSFAAGDMLCAYMPYRSANVSIGAVTLEIPAQQQLAAAGNITSSMPMVATHILAADEQNAPVVMRALGGIIRFNVYASGDYAGEKVQRITYAADKAIAGEFAFNLTAEDLDITGYTSTSVGVALNAAYTVGSSLDNATPISMVVAPGNYSGTLTVVTDAATYTYNYSREVERNTYYDANINLTEAANRQANSGGGSEVQETKTATLTYAECKSVISGYENPKTYKNSYGEWTICAYDYGSAIQINGSKVAYIGTPTFDAPIHKVEIECSPSYTKSIYLCTEPGSKSYSGLVAQAVATGYTGVVTIENSTYNRLYIRSENACRITSLTVYYGGNGEGGGTTPTPSTEPSFSSITADVTAVTATGASDGKATLSAKIAYSGTGTLTETGIGYKASSESAYRNTSCGTSLSPSVSLTSLAVGTYNYRVYAIVDGKTYESAEQSFSIANYAAPSSAKYSWAELPVITDTNADGRIDTDNTLYYAHHLCAGGEKNAQNNGKARNYTVCYSAKHHCPVWVAAPRHKSYESGASRTDAYGKDPEIPSDIQYNNKNTGGGCNKGHMLGSAERLSSTATNKQVFYYTNIAPQYSDTFNTGGGAWNNLEDHVDGLVCSDTLYVVIGCYFEKFSKNGSPLASPKTISFGGRNDVSCPTMFYYALLRTKKGNSGKRVQDCSASELQCAAFTICHEMEKGHKPQAADMMSVAELEALTGFTYFTNVPNAPKGTYSSSDWL